MTASLSLIHSACAVTAALLVLFKCSMNFFDIISARRRRVEAQRILNVNLNVFHSNPRAKSISRFDRLHNPKSRDTSRECTLVISGHVTRLPNEPSDQPDALLFPEADWLIYCSAKCIAPVGFSKATWPFVRARARQRGLLERVLALKFQSISTNSIAISRVLNASAHLVLCFLRCRLVTIYEDDDGATNDECTLAMF